MKCEDTCPTIYMDTFSDINNNNTNTNDLMVVRKLGHGSFGTVDQVMSMQTELLSARKTAFDKYCDSQQSEIQILQILHNTRHTRHKNIIQLQYITKNNDIILEAMDWSLHQYIRLLFNTQTYITQVMFIHYMTQLIDSVVFIHSLGVIHRDIKPSNILLDKSGRLVLSDFGISVQIHDNNVIVGSGKIMSSLWYRAPEVVYTDMASSFKPCIDMWSIGCVLYEMLFQMPLFRLEQTKFKSEKEEREALLKCIDKNIQLVDEIREDRVKKLVRSLVCKDINKRMTAIEAKQYISNNF
jgi:serine/threonine protein kinase